MLTINPMKKFLCAALVLTSLTLSTQSTQAVPLDKIIAIVNDELILESEFNANISRAVEQIKQQNAKHPGSQVLRNQVMEQMITRTIMLKMAANQGIKVTDRQLNGTITQIANNNGMSLAKFREVLIAQGQDYILTRERIRDDILIRQLQESNISQRIQISDREVQYFLRSQTGKSKTEVLVSDILIAIQSPVTPKNIKTAKLKAQSIHQKLVSGASFSNMAISSSNAAHALNGGDMGWRKIASCPPL